MSQINIRTDNVAELMSTVSNMMRQIDNVSSQLSSHMRYIDNSIKSQSNINYRMNCVCNKLSETYNRLSSLLSVMDMAVNTYNDAEQQVIYLTKDLQDIYGGDGSSFWNGFISNVQSFADEAISEVKDIYNDAENTVKNVEKWYDDNKEYIDKLLIDGAVLVVSAVLFVLAPEAAPLIFAADAYLLAKSGVQVHSDYEALKANEAANDADANGDLEGANELREKAKNESKFSMKNVFEIGGGEIAGNLVGSFTGMAYTLSGNNFENGFNEGFNKGFNSKITKEGSDLIYDGVDTTANVISLKNGFKNGSEVVDTVRNATNETSKFTKFIKAWDGKTEKIFGKDYINSIKDEKKVIGNTKKITDVLSNIKDGIDNPSNRPKDIKNSLGDIPKFGSTEKDIFDTYDDITSDLGIKTPTNQLK